MADYFPENEDQVLERKAPSRVRQALYVLIVLMMVLILLLNLTGLSHWFLIGRISLTDFKGRTEADILSQLGEPDYRSQVQSFTPGEGFGMAPQRLAEGDQFFYLNFIMGSRMFVFHLVSPQTYNKHTGELVLGDAWVVLEYYSGNRYVIY